MLFTPDLRQSECEGELAAGRELFNFYFGRILADRNSDMAAALVGFRPDFRGRRCFGDTATWMPATTLRGFFKDFFMSGCGNADIPAAPVISRLTRDLLRPLPFRRVHVLSVRRFQSISNLLADWVRLP